MTRDLMKAFFDRPTTSEGGCLEMYLWWPHTRPREDHIKKTTTTLLCSGACPNKCCCCCCPNRVQDAGSVLLPPWSQLAQLQLQVCAMLDEIVGINGLTSLIQYSQFLVPIWILLPSECLVLGSYESNMPQGLGHQISGRILGFW